MPVYQHAFFERTADRFPGAPAVDDHGRATTYAELDGRANRIAHLLRGLPCSPNDRVIVFTEKTADQYAAVLGALKAGACWVPFSNAFPAARQQSLTETLRPIAIIADTTTRDAALTLAAEAEETPAVLVLGASDGADTGVLTESDLAAQPDTRPDMGTLTSDDLAYIIFTSGSTGTPKGVMVRHRNTARFLDHCHGFFDIDPGARFAHFSELTFDPSVFDLFYAWAVGGTVVPANRRSYRVNPAQFLVKERINVLFCVPTVIAMIEEAERLGDPALANVQHLLLTGEPVPSALVKRWYDAYPDCTVYNMYGTTETAIVSHWYAIPRTIDGQRPIPLGWPLPDMRVQLLDGDRPVDSGAIGESVVAGPQVSPGYWDNPYLTERSFGPDPIDPQAPVTVYRTGDLLRRTPDGLYHYVGRQDTQLKVRGHRVDLGEIEHVLAHCDGVRDAVVVAVQGSTAADTRLIAFVREAGESDLDKLRQSAGETLPNYMVPSLFLPMLGDFPRNNNGKIDRIALGRLARDAFTNEVSYG